jgi:MATE family multidrug resistance protein
MQANIFNQYKPYFSKILALSYPIVIGQLGIVLMGVADVVMVGKLEPINLAAVSLANSVYFLLAIIGIGTLTAISPLVAKAKAEAHDNTCAFLYRDGILASVLLALFLMLGIWFLTINLEWFKQTEEVTNLTKNYLHLLNVGTLPMLFFFGIETIQ